MWRVTVSGVHKTIPVQVRDQLVNLLQRIATLDHPLQHGDVTKLRVGESYRLKINYHYRALFTVNDGSIDVYAVCHRKDAY